MIQSQDLSDFPKLARAFPMSLGNLKCLFSHWAFAYQPYLRLASMLRTGQVNFSTVFKYANNIFASVSNNFDMIKSAQKILHSFILLVQISN